MKIKLKNWYAGLDELGREIPASTPEHFIEALRGVRDVLLRESDWTQVGDVVLPEGEKEQWIQFREMLRNLPTQYTIATITDVIEIANPPTSVPKTWKVLTPEYYEERQAQIETIRKAIADSGHAAQDHTDADHSH